MAVYRNAITYNYKVQVTAMKCAQGMGLESESMLSTKTNTQTNKQTDKQTRLNLKMLPLQKKYKWLKLNIIITIIIAYSRNYQGQLTNSG